MVQAFRVVGVVATSCVVSACAGDTADANSNTQGPSGTNTAEDRGYDQSTPDAAVTPSDAAGRDGGGTRLQPASDAGVRDHPPDSAAKPQQSSRAEGGSTAPYEDASTPGDADADVAFLNVRVDSITASRALVRFDTSEPTSCEAAFGTAPDVLDRTATDPDMEEGQLVLEHNVPLEDLLPNRTYYWRAKATNAAGDTFLSELFDFRTIETEAESPEAMNVALQEAGTSIGAVSSNFGGGGNDDGWGANSAIDGMMATEWSSSGDGDDAWLTLDLGQTRTISRFGFRSRQMSDGSAIIKSVQLIFDEDTTAGPYMTPHPDQAYLFVLEAPVAARSVRIEAVETTGGNTGAKEIQLYGE